MVGNVNISGEGRPFKPEGRNEKKRKVWMAGG